MNSSLLAAIPNAGTYIEYTIEREAGVNRESRAAFRPHLDAADGRVRLPQGPGWGVTMNEDWLSAATYQKSERRP